MSTEPATVSAPTAASYSRALVWITLALVLLADALDLIDSTVTTVAAPTIARDIGGGELLIKWLGASYALALGALLVVGGRLGDRYGQRRLFLIGIAGFTLASLACGLTATPALLIVARAVQGGFGAFLIPQGMAIMVRTFPRSALKTAFNVFGPLLGLASVGGPVLAGLIISANIAGLGWRPIFLINVVLGTVGFVVALLLLPKVEADRTVRIDGLAAATLIVAIFALILGLTDGPSTGWDGWSIPEVGIGVVFFGLFVQRQRSSVDPLLKPALFRNRGFVFGLIIGLVFFAVTTGLLYVVSLYMQDTLGADALHAALTLLPMMFGLIIASFVSGALMERLGRWLVAIGFMLSIIGAAWLLILILGQGAATSLWELSPPVFIMGLGMGAGFGTIFNFALGDVADDEAGSASGSMEAVQQLASGIGAALVTSLYFNVATPGSPQAMVFTIGVVLALTIVCLPLVALLPREARAEER
ncbi:MFS transporter [Parafrigoribacterium soli]|uniref:MFS transporter n=1 Tax=Parafrigoribacterium soli TaxID=3144663 RepID=UPI0032EDD60C